MPTLNQLIQNICRKKKIHKFKMVALQKNPQKKGVCIKIFNRTPKKPNSAQRKIAKVKLSNKRRIQAYIPGEGHTLKEFAVVLIRGGRVPDVPGVKYHLIRGKYDFYGVIGRRTSRSQYGSKKKKK